MTTVFIGGSRSVSRLNDAVKRRLNTIIQKQIPVLVGDANGADKAIQSHFRDMAYELVTIFCTGDVCRNKLADWPVTHIQPTESARRKDRTFFTLKDRAMTSKATHGFMLWDAESLGTLANVVRLQREGRPVVVYVQPTNAFVDVRRHQDLLALAKYCTPELLSRAEQSVASELGELSKATTFENLPLF